MEGVATGELAAALAEMRAAQTYGLFIDINLMSGAGTVFGIETDTPDVLAIFNSGGPIVDLDVAGDGISLAGDLGGDAEAPLVIGLQGIPISETPPTTGQALVFDGTEYSPSSTGGGGGGGVDIGGDLGGTDSVPLVIGLQGNDVSATAPTNGQVLKWASAGNNWKPGNALNPPAGDIGGTATAPVVVGIQWESVAATPLPTTNQLLRYNGSQWAPATVTTGTGVSIAKDLGGTDTAPLVVGLQGNPVASGTPTTGEVLEWNGTAWAPASPGGGGGGAANALIVRKFLIPYNASGLANATALIYAATLDDVIYDAVLSVRVAWAGGVAPAYLDFGTWTSGNNGMLAQAGQQNQALPGNPAGCWPLGVADTDVTGNAGLSINAGPLSLAATYASFAAAASGSVMPRPLVFLDAGMSLYAAITMDGSNATATAASVTAPHAPSPVPFIVTTGTNNQFSLIDAAPGGGPTASINFTVAQSLTGYTFPGTGAGSLCAALNAATSGSDVFSNHGTFTPDITNSFLVCTSNIVGAGSNVCLLGPGNNNDITAGLGFVQPGVFLGGAGGDPGASAGSAILLLLTATPA